MCYQVVERFSVCRCLYYRHSIDPCQAYGQRGHTIQEKTVLVGYACQNHALRRVAPGQSSLGGGRGGHQPDSGYSSANYGYSSSYRHDDRVSPSTELTVTSAGGQRQAGLRLRVRHWWLAFRRYCGGMNWTSRGVQQDPGGAV
ncbi:MAG: hypothetical protein M1832_001011 [Thelocarpon impressellum]|nr:MAG: hypothetical protein M1832_001011 [Thelocarpon impressellum]